MNEPPMKVEQSRTKYIEADIDLMMIHKLLRLHCAQCIGSREGLNNRKERNAKKNEIINFRRTYFSSLASIDFNRKYFKPTGVLRTYLLRNLTLRYFDSTIGQQSRSLLLTQSCIVHVILHHTLLEFFVVASQLLALTEVDMLTVVPQHNIECSSVCRVKLEHQRARKLRARLTVESVCFSESVQFLDADTGADVEINQQRVDVGVMSSKHRPSQWHGRVLNPFVKSREHPLKLGCVHRFGIVPCHLEKVTKVVQVPHVLQIALLDWLSTAEELVSKNCVEGRTHIDHIQRLAYRQFFFDQSNQRFVTSIHLVNCCMLCVEVDIDLWIAVDEDIVVLAVWEE